MAREDKITCAFSSYVRQIRMLMEDKSIGSKNLILISNILESSDPYKLPGNDISVRRCLGRRGLQELSRLVEKDFTVEEKGSLKYQIKKFLEFEILRIQKPQSQAIEDLVLTYFPCLSDVQNLDYKRFINALKLYVEHVEHIYLPIDIYLYGDFTTKKTTKHSYIDIAVLSKAFSGDSAAQTKQLIKELPRSRYSFVRVVAFALDEFKRENIERKIFLVSFENERCMKRIEHFK